ncbi:MAG: Methyltransferase type 12 [Candidatus Moranbacteria bacterium GW2011_GWF2_35_39]|nr:MAG: Methyltransferase type 12 [Candidatus Moranbacteria bacterium GW2011_GWF2_35_39]
MFNKILKKIKKTISAIYSYPKMILKDDQYNEYWENRDLKTADQLNNFQKARAKFVLKTIKENSTILDIGCGNGAILSYINSKKKLARLIGIDFSDKALNLAGKNGIEVIRKDISTLSEDGDMFGVDYILMFEILEHIADSEKLLAWAVKNAKSGVFFSVPNTGFVTHRFRLLLGRFPLQWRVRPSEHLRFWTVRDMKWWLKNIGYDKYEIKLYEGAPLLNRIWPSMFSAGIFVRIAAN